MPTFPNKNEKMHNEATKSYFTGNDGDERYYLWVRESNSVIYSRDVTFNEKMINCVKAVQLSIIHENKTTFEPTNQGKSEEKFDEEDFSNK